MKKTVFPPIVFIEDILKSGRFLDLDPGPVPAGI